jgi:hypothetical protein
MIDYHYILKNERVTLAFLGMKLSKFNELLTDFTKAYYSIRQSKFYANKKHIRKYGGGRKAKLFNKPSNHLAFTLFYVRMYPTFDLAQGLFQLDRANLHHWAMLGMEILEAVTKTKISLPAERTTSLEGLFKIIPDLKEHIFDATEQRMNRPKKNQEEFYSGKKKCHTKKRQIICTSQGKLIGISHVRPGTIHDKKLADEESHFLHAPPESTALADTGYIGIKADNNAQVTIPFKKPKGQELTENQKLENKYISQRRVKVENVICGLKVFRVFTEKIRYRVKIDDQISNIVGGLYNFKKGY